VADRFEAGESGFKVEEIRGFSGIERTGSLYLILITIPRNSAAGHDVPSLCSFVFI